MGATVHKLGRKCQPWVNVSVKHNVAKSVNRSILKKSWHIGFSVFIIHSSMALPYCHRLNMESDLQSLLGSSVYSGSHWAKPRNSSPPPRIWAHIGGRYWSAKIDNISLWPPAYCCRSPNKMEKSIDKKCIGRTTCIETLLSIGWRNFISEKSTKSSPGRNLL